ncbi:MAG TPA: hypothetical protein VMH33_09310, partial [Solirubrobacterales bacterium]|nr:hypothetical protein [Solirubrobacterales bacterium]
MSKQAKHSSPAERGGSGFLGSVSGRRATASLEAEGNGAPSGHLIRLALLTTAIALIFLFAISAQAFAHGTITIEGAGTGSGEVTGGGPGEPLHCVITAGVAAATGCTTYGAG